MNLKRLRILSLKPFMAYLKVWKESKKTAHLITEAFYGIFESMERLLDKPDF